MADKGDMKRTIFLIALVGLASVLSAATGLRLENDTESLVYYAVVSASNPQDPAIMGRDEVRALVEAGPERFAYLPARAVHQGFQLPQGGGWLLMLVAQGAYFAPQWLKLPGASSLGPGIDAYISFLAAHSMKDNSGNRLLISSLDLALPSGGIKIDGRFVDWLPVPEVLTSRNGAVVAVNRSDRNGTVGIKPSDAMSRAKGGTDLELVKVESDAQSYYLMISSRSAMVRGLSFIIKAAPAGATTASFAIEIPVADLGGPVLLWPQTKPASDEPRLIGDFAQIGLFLEARIMKAELSPEQAKIFADPRARFAVSSSWSDGSFAEEWSYGSFEGKTLSPKGK